MQSVSGFESVGLKMESETIAFEGQVEVWKAKK